MNQSHDELKTALLEGIKKAPEARAMITKIVAIDGGGGAGKSTLAKHLSEWLGGAPIINTDDFASWAEPLNWWPRLLEQALVPLSHNRPAHYQRYDWQKLELAEWRDVPAGDVIILEGVSALRREFRPYLAYRIWVEVDPALRLQRGMARERGIQGEANLERWLKWQAAEEAHFAMDRPQEVADITVNAESEEYHIDAHRPHH